MKKISIAILALITILVACKKTPEVNLKYVDVERELITVGVNTATVQCDYQYITTLKKAFFYYGEGTNETEMNLAEMRVVQNTLYVDLSGLKGNTTYSYYYEFVNGFNSMRSETKTFKTEASPIVPPEITLPTVVTAMVTEITTNSAKGGGEVTNDGGAEVTERGICWSTNENPTLSDNHIAVGSGIGSFMALMESLEANTTYHVRAYATNEVGTAYGLDREFTTFSGGSGEVPTGAINGLFTINEHGDQVYFSQGNLQYQASTSLWRFAEKQWDYVGEENTNISPTYDGWIDLFGWGTSGWNNGNVYYHPYDYDYLTEWNANDYGLGYGPTDGTNYEYDLTGTYANADWGVYNSIYNGGNIHGRWRTLTYNEWLYVLEIRITHSGIRYAKASVNGVNGVIVLPDDWDSAVFALNYTNRPDAPFTTNVITEESWAVLEINGAVFLPAASARYGTLVTIDSSFPYGKYWSVTCHNTNNPAHSCYLYFYHSDTHSALTVGYFGGDRSNGLSVRLVQDANK